MEELRATTIQNESVTTPTPIEAPVPKSAVHNILVGPNGIRAAWRMLIYIAIVAALFTGVRQVRRAIWGTTPPPPAGAPLTPQLVISPYIRVFACLLLAAFIMSKIEKRPMRWYGLGAREAFGAHFWEGALWGFGSLSVLLLVLRANGAFYFGDVATHGAELAKYGALWGVVFLLVGFNEEYLFRGYAQYTVTTGIGFWPALVVLSALFTAGHASNPGETWIGLTDVFLGGIVLGVMLQRTGTLWFAVAFHAAWDWGQSFVYGVADSGMKSAGTWLSPHIPQDKPWWLTGGTVGPEGSIFSCCLELLLIALVMWRFKQVRYPEGIQSPVISRQPAAEAGPLP